MLISRRWVFASALALALSAGTNSLSAEEPAAPAEEAGAAAELEDSFLNLTSSRATGSWWGARTTLEDAGISFGARVLLDYSVNVSGGDHPGDAFHHLFFADLTLDTAKLLDHEGGTFYLSFSTSNGRSISEVVGDLQVLNNWDNDDRTQIDEAWYQQMFFEGTLRVKAGKIDANCDFACPENACDFVNSSASYSPTILGIPSYPDSAFGLEVHYQPVPWLSMGFGVFDGALQEGVATGSRGPATLFGPPGDLFFIGELGLHWEAIPCAPQSQLPGRIALGGWGHTGDFDRFDGQVAKGTQGAYLIFDQWLYRTNPEAEEDPQGLSMFLQYGWADAELAAITQHLGAGLTYNGLIPGREDDRTGVAMHLAWLSNEAGSGLDRDYEIALEAFYAVQMTPWAMLKPDVQYVIHPGGVTGVDDALVFTLRFEVNF